MPVNTTMILPSHGPVTGNTVVTVSGLNFVATNETTVRFVNQANSLVSTVSASFVDSQHVTCITPEFSMPVIADVSVALNGQQYTDDTVPFSFYVTPVTVISTSPMSGPVSGNTMLDIYGANFTDTSEIIVRFQSTEDTNIKSYANGSFVSNSQIRCATPSLDMTSSMATVEVALNGQQFTNNGVQFFYYGMIGSSDVTLTN